MSFDLDQLASLFGKYQRRFTDLSLKYPEESLATWGQRLAVTTEIVGVIQKAIIEISQQRLFWAGQVDVLDRLAKNETPQNPAPFGLTKEEIDSTCDMLSKPLGGLPAA